MRMFLTDKVSDAMTREIIKRIRESYICVESRDMVCDVGIRYIKHVISNKFQDFPDLRTLCSWVQSASDAVSPPGKARYAIRIASILRDTEELLSFYAGLPSIIFSEFTQIFAQACDKLRLKTISFGSGIFERVLCNKHSSMFIPGRIDTSYFDKHYPTQQKLRQICWPGSNLTEHDNAAYDGYFFAVPDVRRWNEICQRHIRTSMPHDDLSLTGLSFMAVHSAKTNDCKNYENSQSAANIIRRRGNSACIVRSPSKDLISLITGKDLLNDVLFHDSDIILFVSNNWKGDSHENIYEKQRDEYGRIFVPGEY